MMGLHVGLRRTEAVAGIVGISRMLGVPELLRTEIYTRSPVLLIHGTDDDVIPFCSMSEASNALSSEGIAVQTYASPLLWHSVAQNGLVAATAFAKSVLT